MDVPFPAGDAPEVERVADWVEFRTLSGNVPFKRGDLKAAVSIEDIDDPELLEDRVWDELALRAAIFGSDWPVRIDGSFIRRRRPSPVDLDYYRFLLCLGLGLVETEDRQLFELLVAHALTGITGHVGLHVGAPASEGMDPSFRKRVEAYVEASGLIDAEEVIRAPLPADKDLGLDAVSWLPFSDTRSGSVHFLAQCATGDDWDTKFADLRVRVWRRHINWATDPVRVFSVPFALTMLPERWVRMCTDAGLVLDRPRLMELDRRSPISASLSASVRQRVKHLTL